MNKDQILAKIVEVKTELALTQSAYSKACDAVNRMESDPASYFDDELSESFDEFLNELYQDAFDALPITIGNHGYAAEIIKNEDNSFYRESYNNWLNDSDNFDLSQFDEYTDQVDLCDELDNKISDLESELSELDDMLDYLEDEEIA